MVDRVLFGFGRSPGTVLPLSAQLLCCISAHQQYRRNLRRIVRTIRRGLVSVYDVLACFHLLVCVLEEVCVTTRISLSSTLLRARHLSLVAGGYIDCGRRAPCNANRSFHGAPHLKSILIYTYFFHEWEQEKGGVDAHPPPKMGARNSHWWLATNAYALTRKVHEHI